MLQPYDIDEPGCTWKECYYGGHQSLEQSENQILQVSAREWETARERDTSMKEWEREREKKERERLYYP